ncbi:MAG TPA: hypothetical protein PKC28_09915 [Bdellovibrionales bacterium]|nr:hypothetical protein [Bdellovibrionales bacterium]
MSKLFTLAVFALTSVSALANANPCLDGVLANQNFRDLTLQQVECIADQDSVKASLVSLCSSDQRQFSSTYNTYRKYEVDYGNAVASLQAAKDDSAREAALLDTQNIDQEWKAIGFKNEVQALLWPIVQAKSTCK